MWYTLKRTLARFMNLKFKFKIYLFLGELSTYWNHAKEKMEVRQEGKPQLKQL